MIKKFINQIKQELTEMKNPWERRSYKLIITSAVMIGLGLILGSFIPYTVFLATTGSFALLVGIALYIFSQLNTKDSTRDTIDKTGQVNTTDEQKN
jgi:hypothetical protein